MKNNGLNRNLIESPVYYTLCTTPALLKKELKKYEPQEQVFTCPEGGAMTYFFERSDGSPSAIVLLYDHEFDTELLFGLLVHEAVHIFQKIRNWFGESQPSDEFEAYSIQHISQELFYEFNRQTKKKKPNVKKKK